MIPCEESAVKKALTRDCFDRGIPRRQRENLSQLSPARLCRVSRLSPGQICLLAPLTLIREKFIRNFIQPLDSLIACFQSIPGS